MYFLSLVGKIFGYVWNLFKRNPNRVCDVNTTDPVHPSQPKKSKKYRDKATQTLTNLFTPQYPKFTLINAENTGLDYRPSPGDLISSSRLDIVPRYPTRHVSRQRPDYIMRTDSSDSLASADTSLRTHRTISRSNSNQSNKVIKTIETDEYSMVLKSREDNPIPQLIFRPKQE